jgi:ATP adenylyltransferase
VSLGHLWAGWRHFYIQDATERERAGTATHDPAACVFCQLAESGPPSVDNLVVWRGEWSFVVLTLPLRHVGTLSDLTVAESAEVWAATRAAIEAIERAYDPDGLNMGANLGRAAGAGLPGHVHLHVLPRWLGDTNFMTSVASTRVIPEPLPVAWNKLSDAWPG